MTLVEMYLREEDAERRTSLVCPDEEMNWFAEVEEEGKMARRVENHLIRFGD
jgi:hypothetical protein